MYKLAVVRDQSGPCVMVAAGDRLIDLSEVVGADAMVRLGGPPADLLPILNAWAEWDELLSDAASRLPAGAGRSIDAETMFLPPLAAPGKIICIGANYHDHIEEMAIPMAPTYPYSFLKPANNTLRGSGVGVAVPAGVEMMDWEAELAVVIGIECRDVTAADALSVIAGYANFNDLSARDWLASRPGVGVDWVRHKAHDGFAPMGPYLLPARFVDDPQQLPVRLSVNGIRKQDSSTAQMVFGVVPIIEHLSSIMTLSPGDVIATGTPAGVGHGQKPPQFLKRGDEVRMQVGGLGELVTPIL
ncbi:MAG: fumarylacetoacetate hydrolase family protein [Sphingomonas sp.]|uniref:fumarylacetoacetate hydrolase family protein n=1 Tax=Sphingomonas sp. TaxID=28214 RepID=UPI0025DA7FB7|nr:fumarylacetoacetate hydrolase family protein [Sphingomonas sp.]MBX3563575.1 fumarylacetoacetate hydrolase family protein [Sphingomonas sp.]